MAGEPVERSLGRGIDALSLVWEKPRAGQAGDIHDVAIAGAVRQVLTHPRLLRQADGEEQRYSDVHAEVPVDVAQCGGAVDDSQRVPIRVRGVVHEQIDTPEPGQCDVDDSLDLVVLLEVGGHDVHLAPVLRQLDVGLNGIDERFVL